MAARHCIIIVMFAFIFFFNEVRGHCLERHKSLLLKFKHSLVIHESPIQEEKSPKLANWNSSTDCCLWPGVTCSGTYVTGLDLSYEGIVGGFNDSSPLFDLTSLTSLNLAYMSQNTVIPSGIGRLVNLMNLDMYGSHFIGQIPIEVSNLTRLVSLDFSSDYHHLKAENPNLGMLVGNLSNLIDLRLDIINLSSQSREWCQVLSSSTPRLQVLKLYDCELLGPIRDSLQNLTHLSIVDLSRNDFSGPIPCGVFASLENLTSLTLSGCSLSGQIPESISQLEHLIYLDMSNNNLDGHIPSFSRTRNLTVLDLSYNHLHGSILATDWKKLHQMESLILRSNNLSGSIPTSLFETPSLVSLELGENHFTGFTDESNITTSSSQLEELYLDDNDLQGPFPPFIYGLNSLHTLVLSFNNWSDTFHMDTGSVIQLRSLGLASCNLKQFPPFLTNQSRLWKLDLSDNLIDGHIPDHIWNISGLTYLDLSNNQIDGHIPDQIWNISGLTYLDLSNNQISGHIPDQIWNMSALTYVNLSHNQLEFLARGREEYSVRLEILDLSSNKLHGSIPKSICNMTGLFMLDLSNNSLDGTLPPCWPPDLWVVNLSKNNITGIIPDTLPLFLQTLDLSQNSFHGEIPKSLEGCTNLQVLDLGYNQLHGMFPCWINNLGLLTVLVLRSNSLYGSIQCLNHDFNLARLQIMDIASNNFSGNLPSQGFLMWEAMMVPTSEMAGGQYLQFSIGDGLFINTVLVTVKGNEWILTKISFNYALVDFSDNKFEGNIPYELGELKFLYALNLSHNQLSGQIPSSFGNLYRIESLDLSKNDLSGKIPEQLASLNFLSALNLSFNHLEGMIPNGRQFQTFTDASFKENKCLCGHPLNTSCGNEGMSSPPNPPYESEDELGDGFKFRDIFIATEIGYAFGFGLVIMPLFFWSTWRKRYYKCIDKVLKSIC